MVLSKKQRLGAVLSGCLLASVSCAQVSMTFDFNHRGQTVTEHGRDLRQQAAAIPDCMATVLREKGMTDEEFAAMMPILDHLIETLSK